MIKQCKKCGSENLYLEPRIEGQDVMTADMVALKCKDCGSWLKWCPKDERKYYYANTQQKQDTKWQKLKEFIKTNIENDEQEYEESQMPMFAHYLSVERFIINKMEELEAEYE